MQHDLYFGVSLFNVVAPFRDVRGPENWGHENNSGTREDQSAWIRFGPTKLNLTQTSRTNHTQGPTTNRIPDNENTMRSDSQEDPSHESQKMFDACTSTRLRNTLILCDELHIFQKHRTRCQRQHRPDIPFLEPTSTPPGRRHASRRT